jgi:hypothetical protein
LREFVYLDVVSVYSLIASRRGPIATDFTDTSAESFETELGGAVGANAGVAKSEIRSRLLTSQTTGSQVLRKSIVQTTFKELYELEESRLVLRAATSQDMPPMLIKDGHVADWLDGLESPWVIRSEGLTRGRLLELEVELDAEPIFRVSTVVSTLLEILKETPELAELAGYEQLGQIQSIGRVLEKMLAGLIPIRGRAVDYSVLRIGGREWIVHHKILKPLGSLPDAKTLTLDLVGVAEEALFWKDIRRVLFAGSRYRVLGRIGRPELHDAWRAVKLADVFREVVPDLATSLDVFTEAAVTFGATVSGGQEDERQVSALRSALLDFARSLAVQHDRHLNEPEILASTPFQGLSSDMGSVKARRQLFQEVSRRLADEWGVELDPVELAHLRTAAMLDAGVGLDAQGTWGAASQQQKDSPETRFLDAELVAIFW